MCFVVSIRIKETTEYFYKQITLKFAYAKTILRSRLRPKLYYIKKNQTFSLINENMVASSFTMCTWAMQHYHKFVINCICHKF